MVLGKIEREVEVVWHFAKMYVSSGIYFVYQNVLPPNLACLILMAFLVIL